MKTFHAITPIAVGRASRYPLQRLRHAVTLTAAWLRTRWQQAWLDDTTRYLASSADHADLERRMRALDRCAGRPSC